MKRARRVPVQQRPLTKEEATQRVHAHFAARTAAKASLALFWCLKQLGIRAPRDVRQLLFRWITRKQVTIQHAEDLLRHRFHMGMEHLSILQACDIFCENVSRGDFRVMSLASRLVDELIEDRARLAKSAFKWIATPRAALIPMTSFIDLHAGVHNVKRLMMCFLAAEYFCTQQDTRLDDYWRKDDIIWCDFMCALAFMNFQWSYIPPLDVGERDMLTSNTRIVAFMLEEGAALSVSVQTPQKLALFQSLCGAGAKRAAKFVLRGGGFDPTAPNLLGYTAFHIAARRGQWRMVRFLQKFQWPPTLPRCLTPLMCAASEGDYNVVELLLRSENVHATNGRCTVLHYAMLGRRPDVFRRLIRAGAALNEDLLRESIAAGAPEITRLLVDEYGMRPNKDELHMACAASAQPMVVFLLSRGADPARLSAGGETARQLAARLGLDEICALLDSFTSVAPSSQ